MFMRTFDRGLIPLVLGAMLTIGGCNREPDNAELAQAVNAEIAKLWKTCELKKIGATYGLVQDVWYVPAGQNFRAGIDRAADWQLPSCK